MLTGIHKAANEAMRIMTSKYKLHPLGISVAVLHAFRAELTL